MTISLAPYGEKAYIECMEPITLSSDLRANLTTYVEWMRAELAVTQHVSGDDCPHCGIQNEIAAVETVLADGFYFEPEW